jgi:Flp pilus assembly protein TadB
MGIFDKIKQLAGTNVQTVKESESISNDMYDAQLEKLIEMSLADGVLTEKEKQILFRKAESLGIDLDEFEMVLETRLQERQNRQTGKFDKNPEIIKYIVLIVLVIIGIFILYIFRKVIVLLIILAALGVSVFLYLKYIRKKRRRRRRRRHWY